MSGVALGQRVSHIFGIWTCDHFTTQPLRRTKAWPGNQADVLQSQNLPPSASYNHGNTILVTPRQWLVVTVRQLKCRLNSNEFREYIAVLEYNWKWKWSLDKKDIRYFESSEYFVRYCEVFWLLFIETDRDYFIFSFLVVDLNYKKKFQDLFLEIKFCWANPKKYLVKTGNMIKVWESFLEKYFINCSRSGVRSLWILQVLKFSRNIQ